MGPPLPRVAPAGLVRGPDPLGGGGPGGQARDGGRPGRAGPARRARGPRPCPVRPRRLRGGAPGQGAWGGGGRRAQLQPLRHGRPLHPDDRRAGLCRCRDHQRQPGHGPVGGQGEGGRGQPLVDRRPGRHARRDGHGHRQRQRGQGQDLRRQGARGGHPRGVGAGRQGPAHHRPGGRHRRGDPAHRRPQGLRHLLHDGRALGRAHRRLVRHRGQRSPAGRAAAAAATWSWPSTSPPWPTPATSAGAWRR